MSSWKLLEGNTTSRFSLEHLTVEGAFEGIILDTVNSRDAEAEAEAEAVILVSRFSIHGLDNY